MARTTRILGTIAVAGMMVMLSSCSGPTKEEVRRATAEMQTTNDIKQFSSAYMKYLEEKFGPPADEKAFAAWISAKQPEVVPVFARLQAEGYKVYWDATVNQPAKPENTVLIYPADAATKGGLVGFADVSVRMVTAEEFNAAAKPPTK